MLCPLRKLFGGLRCRSSHTNVARASKHLGIFVSHRFEIFGCGQLSVLKVSGTAPRARSDRRQSDTTWADVQHVAL